MKISIFIKLEIKRQTFLYSLHWREKEKSANKGTCKQSKVGSLVPNISDSHTKFQNPRSSNYQEIFDDQNFNNHNIGEIERDRKKEKEGKIILTTLLLLNRNYS